MRAHCSISEFAYNRAVLVGYSSRVDLTRTTLLVTVVDGVGADRVQPGGFRGVVVGISLTDGRTRSTPPPGFGICGISSRFSSTSTARGNFKGHRFGPEDKHSSTVSTRIENKIVTRASTTTLLPSFVVLAEPSPYSFTTIKLLRMIFSFFILQPCNCPSIYGVGTWQLYCPTTVFCINCCIIRT